MLPFKGFDGFAIQRFCTLPFYALVLNHFIRDDGEKKVQVEFLGPVVNIRFQLRGAKRRKSKQKNISDEKSAIGSNQS